jgi:cell wall-associated NlpC family hydrolase
VARASDLIRRRGFAAHIACLSRLSALVLGASLLAVVPATAQPPAALYSSNGPSEAAPATTVDSTERRGPFAIFGNSRRSAVRDSLVTLARQQLGRRYVLGGASPEKGFDCSGLIRYVLAKLEIKVPRTAAQQERVGEQVAKDTSELQPGDLVTFGRGSRATHIGIYVGNGRFIHASSAAGRVVESRLIRPPARLIKPWRGARRILAGADSTAVAADAESEG